MDESSLHYNKVMPIQIMIDVSLLLYTKRRNAQCFTYMYNFQNRKFVLFIEDDIHFIHAKHHPTSSVTSTTWHMCTAVVDVHDKMEAVDLGDDITQNHSNVQVTMEDGSVRPCRGVLTFSTSLVLYLLKVEIITSKASFNISLCNSKSSTGQNYVEKSFKELR